MCYHLWLASPLSLTEIRSMLPAALAADVAPAAEQAPFRALLPGTLTVAQVRAGGCACALVIGGTAGDREDERHLRQRYAAAGMPRDRIIAALERHRRGIPAGTASATRDTLRQALAAFVAEHARNAGPSLYHLGFGAEAAAGLPGPKTSSATRSVAEVRSQPGTWLTEAVPCLIVR